MANTFRIHRGPSLTSLVDAQDCLCYTIESHTSNGRSSSTVRTVTQKRSYTGDFPDFWYDEIAQISWRFRATSVTFGKRVVKLNSFLRSDKRFANSHVFTGPNEQPLRWKIKGQLLELRHQESDALIALILPPHRDGSFSLRARKPRLPASLEVLPQYAKDTQLLNAIVITWTVLDGLIRDKDIDCAV